MLLLGSMNSLWFSESKLPSVISDMAVGNVLAPAKFFMCFMLQLFVGVTPIQLHTKENYSDVYDVLNN